MNLLPKWAHSPGLWATWNFLGSQVMLNFCFFKPKSCHNFKILLKGAAKALAMQPRCDLK